MGHMQTDLQNTKRFRIKYGFGLVTFSLFNALFCVTINYYYAPLPCGRRYKYIFVIFMSLAEPHTVAWTK